MELDVTFSARVWYVSKAPRNTSLPTTRSNKFTSTTPEYEVCRINDGLHNHDFEVFATLFRTDTTCDGPAGKLNADDFSTTVTINHMRVWCQFCFVCSIILQYRNNSYIYWRVCTNSSCNTSIRTRQCSRLANDADRRAPRTSNVDHRRTCRILLLFVHHSHAIALIMITTHPAQSGLELLK